VWRTVSCVEAHEPLLAAGEERIDPASQFGRLDPIAAHDTVKLRAPQELKDDRDLAQG